MVMDTEGHRKDLRAPTDGRAGAPIPVARVRQLSQTFNSPHHCYNERQLSQTHSDRRSTPTVVFHVVDAHRDEAWHGRVLSLTEVTQTAAKHLV